MSESCIVRPNYSICVTKTNDTQESTQYVLATYEPISKQCWHTKEFSIQVCYCQIYSYKSMFWEQTTVFMDFLSHATEKGRVSWNMPQLSSLTLFKSIICNYSVIKTNASNNKINRNIIITNSTHVWGLGAMNMTLCDVQHHVVWEIGTNISQELAAPPFQILHIQSLDQLEHIPNVLFIFTNADQIQADSLYRIVDVARCVNGLLLHGRVAHSIGGQIKTCIPADNGHFEHLFWTELYYIWSHAWKPFSYV
jgi:hypothetical protein